MTDRCSLCNEPITNIDGVCHYLLCGIYKKPIKKEPMTPQDLYNEVTGLLDAGEEVMLTRDDGMFMIISPLKDRDGDYRNSGWQYTKEDAKNYRGDEEGETKKNFLEEAQEDNWKIVSSTPPSPPIIEVGTKVREINLNFVMEVVDYKSGTYTIFDGEHKICCDRSAFSLYLGDKEEEATITMPELEEAKKLFDDFSEGMNKLFNK